MLARALVRRFPVFGFRDFRLLFAERLLAPAAFGFSLVGVSFAVLYATGSTAELSYVLAAQIAPSLLFTLVELGFALMQQGALDSATTAYRRAIAINPWEPGAYANLGIVYLRSGALQPAVQALEKAVELNPGLPDAHFALASAYAQLGERARAADALERGLEFDPHNSNARRMLEAVRGP